MASNSSDVWGSDRVVIAVGGALLFLIAVVAIAREASPAWSTVQDEVTDIVTERLGPERASAVPRGLRQIWIAELDRVDRCVVCHVTIDWGQELAGAPNPARSHPHPKLLASHPIESFGCTLCHGGQGWATTKDAAHGRAEFWEEPLLDAKLARRYELTAAELMETRCNACHLHEAEVEGMPLLNEAKAQVAKRRCDRCHTIRGQGGNKAPDLSRVGEKHPSRFHFPKGWMKPHTALQWHIDHFLEPKAMSPTTDMPKFTLTRRQASGLALLVLSWRKSRLPPEWMPREKGPLGER